MKRRLNARKRANRYKAEAEALRKELRLAKRQLSDMRTDDWFRNPVVIACEGRVDLDLWHMVGRRMDIPEFTLRCRWKQGNPFTPENHFATYSARLYCERGATLGKIGADYLIRMMGGILSHWVQEDSR